MAKTKKPVKRNKRSSGKSTGDNDSLDVIIDFVLRAPTLGAGLLLLACLTVLALIFPGGSLGASWNDTLHRTFGWGAFLTPILLVVFGLGLVRPQFDGNYRLRWQVAIGWLTLFAACLMLLQGLTANPLAAGQFGGGYAGYQAFRLFTSAIGIPGAWIALIAMFASGVFLAFGLSPLAIGSSIGKPVARGLRRACRWYRDLLFPPTGAKPKPASPARDTKRPALTLPKISLPIKIKPAQRAVKIDTPKKEAAAPPVDPAPVVRGEWQLPLITLLEASTKGEMSTTDIRQKVGLIEDTLADFNVQARVVEVNQGPAVTQFGIEPGFHETRDKTGAVVRREKVKVSEITSLANDIALALAAPTIRIEAPVPGRAVVGIEVPNSSTSMVSLRGVIETERFQRLKVKSKLAVALGENVSGQSAVGDLAKMPHLLIAGATGSGKSVCLNAIITCFLLHTTPDELRLLLIDPKRVELTHFNDAPHLLRPVVVDVDKAVGVLKWVTYEMDQRYKRFEQEHARNIDDYNRAMAKRDEPLLHYIVVVVDELADLMMTAAEEVERTICRLAQLARATGIHLIVATQRPSVDVITGLIKANFPTRISFAMTSQVDSRTILDMAGAEKLLGRGDMLYAPADAAKPVRLQGVYVSDEEIVAIMSFWRAQGPARYVDTLMNVQGWSPDGADGEKDDLYEKAIDLARQHSHVSTSLLQRRLRIGYSRAARIIDTMEEEGIVGPSEGGKSREVLLREGVGSDEALDTAALQRERSEAF